MADRMRRAAALLAALAALLALAGSAPHGAAQSPAPRKPAHIVSIAIGSDEILLSLVPRERVAAVSAYTLLPERSHVAALAKGLPSASRHDAEAILAHAPDRVLLSALASRELEQTLQRAGVAALRVPAPRRLDDVRGAVGEVARAVGEEARGRELLAAFDAAVAELQAQPPLELRALYLAPDFWTAGRGTSINLMLELAGLRNAASELQGNASVSLEWILAAAPDVIIVPTGDPRLDAFAKSLEADPRLAPLRAVREQRVVTAPSREVTVISHFLPEGARALRARVLERRPPAAQR
jgi:iron complex transport system substrate-binding protein